MLLAGFVGRSLGTWLLICGVAAACDDAVYPEKDRILPHIIFIMADDVGWNDIGYHNSYLKTPHLDQLAHTGVRLESLYTLPMCTPSRSALLTGRYPFTYGMQRYVLLSGAPYCLPRDLRLLPHELKKANYTTHLVGKWHLGACNTSCLPTARGFDSFFGSLTGFQDHYTKENIEYPYRRLYDMWNGTDPYFDNSTYMLDLLSERAQQVIREHDGSQPLFLYLASSASHAPLQVPQRYEDLYSHIDDAHRRTYLGMVTALDDVVGSVVSALQEAGLYHNSIIVFQSDNGAQSAGVSSVLPEDCGSNYPLRGGKSSLYEGGTRVVGLIHSPLFKQKEGPAVYNGLMHVVDWYPTLLDMAGLTPDTSQEGLLDGVSHYRSIFCGGEQARSEIVYNLGNGLWITPDNTLSAAIRVRDHKLIVGSAGSPLKDAHVWKTPPELGNGTGSLRGDNCTTSMGTFGCLFNLREDPLEQHNLYDALPDVVAALRARLEHYSNRQSPPLFVSRLPYDQVQQDGVLSTSFC